MRTLAWAGASLAATLVMVGACVGDDPVVAPPPADGGATDGSISTPDGGSDAEGPPVSSEGGPGSCFGKAFDEVLPITVNAPDGGAADVAGIRLDGTTAYYTKQISGHRRILRGTFSPPAGAAPPTLSAEAQLLAMPGPSADEDDESPSVARDGSFIMFVHRNAGSRKMWAAVAGASLTFKSAGVMNELLDIDGDEADPWVAGNPPRALYWGRAEVIPGGGGVRGPRRVTRAVLVPQSLAIPKVEKILPLSSPCPAGNACGAPVLPASETTMLFFITQTGTFVPRIQEVAITPSATENTVTSGTQVIEHPELGQRVPFWIADDGCEAIVGLETTADLRYVRRKAR